MDTKLEMVRSDMGDGGWSLHRPGEMEPVLSGPSEANEDGEWLRPNADDYALAERRAAADELPAE